MKRGRLPAIPASGVLADLRHALRLYARTPASSTFAVAGLAVALAIETAFVSLWNVLELAPHPGFESRRDIVTITRYDGRFSAPLSLDTLERIDAEASTIESVAGVMAARQTFDHEEKSEELMTELVTSGYFEDFGPPVLVGRPFSRADHGSAAAPVAILSYALWQREFGGRGDVLGATVQLRARSRMFGPASDAPEVAKSYQVIGVLPPSMRGTFTADVDLWLPFEQVWPVLGEGRPANTLAMFRCLGRLARGVSLESASAELAGRFQPPPGELNVFSAGTLEATRGVVADLGSYREVHRQLLLFLAGSGLLALTAACNVSLFLLSRAPRRRRELAIRAALGAPRTRLARQLLTESSLLVVAAVTIGLGASIWLAGKLPEVEFLRQLQWRAFRSVTVLDWRVLSLTAGVALFLALLVSLAPIAGLGQIWLETRTRRHLGAGPGQRVFAAAQVALATAVGAAAVAFLWHLTAMAHADIGFNPANVHVVRPEPRTPLRRADFTPSGIAARVAEGVAERQNRRAVLGSLPGVEAITFGNAVPGTALMPMLTQAATPDDPAATVRFDALLVEPDYFDVLGIPFRYGRAFTADEPHQVVVNEALARKLWGRTDVTGELMSIRITPQETPPRYEIVGVVPDISFAHPNATVQPMAFRLLSGPADFEFMLIRSAASSSELERMIEQRVAAGELDLRIQSLEPLVEAWSRQLAPDRARSLLTGVAAVVVLLLTATGYYGTQHYLVAARRRDYAILAALGASPRTIYRLVLWRGLRYGLPGLALGAPLAFILVARLRDGFVTSAVSPPLVVALVAAGMACLLVAATTGPAREARDLEPAPLLKED
jgi:putative ABC transport system permease protein